MRRDSLLPAVVAAVVVAIVGVSVAWGLLDGQDPDGTDGAEDAANIEVSLDPDALTRVLCGLHERQRDQSGFELASDDEQRSLWGAQVTLSVRTTEEIAEGIDQADFAVRELDVGNEPNEENVEAGRSVVDEACAGVDQVAPDGETLARIGCLVAEEFQPTDDEALYAISRLFTAASTIDHDRRDLTEAVEVAVDNEVGTSTAHYETETIEQVDRIVDGPCAELG